jgi:two-component system, LuxR family, sensor kinase FixL
MDDHRFLERLPFAAIITDLNGAISSSNTAMHAIFSKQGIKHKQDYNLYMLHSVNNQKIIHQTIAYCLEKDEKQSVEISETGLSQHLIIEPSSHSTKQVVIYYLPCAAHEASETPAWLATVSKLQKENTHLHLSNQFLNTQLQEKDQIEKYLNESEKSFRLLAENASDLIALIDTAGQWLYLSPACQQLLQHTPNSLIGCSMFNYIHPNKRDDIKALLANNIASKTTVFDATYQARRKDGSYAWFETHFKIINDSRTGQTCEIQTASRDISESIINERTRLLNHRITQATKLTSLEEMASGIAHELNQPLAAIVNFAKGSINFLKKHPGEIAELSEILEKTAAQAQRAGEVVHKLKRFFAKGELIIEQQDVNSIIQEAISFILPEISANKIKIKYQFGKQLPTIPMDKIHIQQVIINIIQNAVDSIKTAKNDSSCITIHTYQKRNSNLVIAISDSGPGFSKEDIDNVFKPFFTTKKQGTGIGLTICQSIIDAHGGKLSITPRSINHHGFVIIVLSSTVKNQEVVHEHGCDRICY